MMFIILQTDKDSVNQEYLKVIFAHLFQYLSVLLILSHLLKSNLTPQKEHNTFILD